MEINILGGTGTTIDSNTFRTRNAFNTCSRTVNPATVINFGVQNPAKARPWRYHGPQFSHARTLLRQQPYEGFALFCVTKRDRRSSSMASGSVFKVDLGDKFIIPGTQALILSFLFSSSSVSLCNSEIEPVPNHSWYWDSARIVRPIRTSLPVMTARNGSTACIFRLSFQCLFYA